MPAVLSPKSINEIQGKIVGGECFPLSLSFAAEMHMHSLSTERKGYSQILSPFFSYHWTSVWLKEKFVTDFDHRSTFYKEE